MHIANTCFPINPSNVIEFWRKAKEMTVFMVLFKIHRWLSSLILQEVLEVGEVKEVGMQKMSSWKVQP